MHSNAWKATANGCFSYQLLIPKQHSHSLILPSGSNCASLVSLLCSLKTERFREPPPQISDYFTDASLWRACQMRSNCCAHVKVFKAQQCCRTRSQYVCKYVWRSLHECLSAAVILCETRLSESHRLVPRRSCLGLGVGLPVSRWQDFLPTFRLGILGRKPVSWLCMACAVLRLSLWLNPLVVGGVQWGDYLHQVIFSCRKTFAPLCTAELDLSKLGKKIFRPILPNLLFRSGMLKALTSVGAPR